MKTMDVCLIAIAVLSFSALATDPNLTNLTLDGTNGFFGVINYPSDTTITAGNNVIINSGAKVTFVARQSVTFNPGVWIKPGALTDIKIDTTTPVPNLSLTPNFYCLNPINGANEIGKFYIDSTNNTCTYCSQLNLSDHSYVTGNSALETGLRMTWLDGAVLVLQPGLQRVGVFDAGTGVLIRNQTGALGTYLIGDPTTHYVYNVGGGSYRASISQSLYTYMGPDGAPPPGPVDCADYINLDAYAWHGGGVGTSYLPTTPLTFINKVCRIAVGDGRVFVINNDDQKIAVYDEYYGTQLNGTPTTPLMSISSPYVASIDNNAAPLNSFVCYISAASVGTRSVKSSSTVSVLSSPWVTPDIRHSKSATVSVVAIKSGKGKDVLVYDWTKILGPGKVRFLDNNSENAANCKAQFSESGLYQLQVKISSDGDSVTDSLSFVIPGKSPK